MVMIKKITRHTPKMWGPSIVGYGCYTYTYESGRTGEAPLVGFAIRGRELVVYVLVEGEEQQSLLFKLGKHRMGKCCLSAMRNTTCLAKMAMAHTKYYFTIYPAVLYCELDRLQRTTICDNDV